MRFLSTLVASTLGTLVALGIILIFGVLFVAMIAVTASGVEPRIADESVLRMDLSGAFPEHKDQSFADFSGSGGSLTIREVVHALETASDDERISGLWMVSQGIQGSWAGVVEIREALEVFKRSGKPMYASTGPNGYSEATYFLSSIADTVFAAPEGAFQLDGFFMAAEFYTGLFEKLNVKPQIVRAGKFKSAVEPYLRENLSDENRLQLQALVDNIDSVYAASLGSGRNLEPAAIKALQTNQTPMSTQEAAEIGLIDALLYEDEVIDRIKNALDVESDDLTTVSLKTYARASNSANGAKSGSEGTIAVYHAEGEITTGSGDVDPFSGTTSLGHEDFVENFDRLRKDESVKAIVLRVNSPGGAATASDAMWRAVARAAEEKPVVASFGGVAASGGYYIAASANHIVANPLSITGSIGAFGLFFNLGDAFQSNLGISFDGVKSGPYADMFSGIRDLTPTERQMLETEIDRTYSTFVGRVADGRKMTEDEVDAVAQGRVWMGTDAVEQGLVDELGGLNTAIERAAELAELEEGTYNLRFLPRPKSVFERLDTMLPSFMARALKTLIMSPMPSPVQQVGIDLSRLGSQNGTVQLRMPFELRIW